jgi:hypothetical protein
MKHAGGATILTILYPRAVAYAGYNVRVPVHKNAHAHTT